MLLLDPSLLSRPPMHPCSAIETKMGRAGELAVSVVQSKDALEDEKEEMADSSKFLAELESSCGTKEKEWAARSATRSQEIAAISEAIGILNDDDALDVFKKALPSSFVQQAGSFLQKGDAKASRAKKAQAIIAGIEHKDQHTKLFLYTLNLKLKQKS